MVYRHIMSSADPKLFIKLVDNIAIMAHLYTNKNIFDIRQIKEIIVSKDYQLPAGWVGSGWRGEMPFYLPYLAGKGDLISYDASKTVAAKLMVQYGFFCGANTLVVTCEPGAPEQDIYPLIATLMHAANDVDVSDDNFRQWLINNRPKVNKVDKPEDKLNNELFKFCQLRERTGNVKITQEIGQELFKRLVDRAEAIAREAVETDISSTDGNEFVLALVNNLINSAPKPTILFERVELKDVRWMNTIYMKENELPFFSGEDYHIAGANEADALRVLGEPCSTATNYKVWYFNMYGRIMCRVYSTQQGLVLNIERETHMDMRRKVLDDVTDMLLNGRLNGKK